MDNWCSQLSSDEEIPSDRETHAKKIRLSDGHEELKISVPSFYKLPCKPVPMYFDTKGALMHRFIHGEFTVICPCAELGDFKDQQHANSHWSMATTGTLTISDSESTYFPGGIPGSMDLFSDWTEQSLSNHTKKVIPQKAQ